MKIGAILVVKNEDELLERNLTYHLDLGFDCVMVLDHCSSDDTNKILRRLMFDSRLLVMRENDPIFDNERLANKALRYLLQRVNLDWVFPLDADEFLFFRKGLKPFLEHLEERKISYGTIGWLNAAVAYQNREDPSDVLSTFLFYKPWQERFWQEPGHFRKAFVRVHPYIEIVAGGHYFRRENNPIFFSGKNFEPEQINQEDACILHYELRGSPRALIKKFENLSRRGVNISNLPQKGWVERIHLFRHYCNVFQTNLAAVEEQWFLGNRTIWGNQISAPAMLPNRTVLNWNRTFLERKARVGEPRPEPHSV